MPLNLQTTADASRKTAVPSRSRELAAAAPRSHRRRYKRAFDLTVLVLAHVVLLPLWVLLWILIPLAIWLSDRGDVFYTQERLGLGNRRFRVIKFRTMVQDAEARTGPVWASESDSRVTAVGRVLRNLHLDEMPQFLNVLRGEMSLVGPRPERPVLAERFSRDIPGFSLRLMVKPGITGLAQLRGRYSTSPRHKLRYDALYIARMSPWLDFKLLIRTALFVLGRSWRAVPGRQPEPGE